MALVIVQDESPESPSPSFPQLIPSISIPALTALQECVQTQNRIIDMLSKTDLAGQMRRLQETQKALALDAFRSTSEALQVNRWRQTWDTLQQDTVRFQVSLREVLASQIRPLHDLTLQLPPDPFERIRQDMARMAQLMTPVFAQLQPLARLVLDPAAIERRALVDVLEAIEEGAAEEALTWLLGRLGLPRDHITALWSVLIEQRWSRATRPFAYVAKATRLLYRRQASPQGRLFNGPLVSLESPGADRRLIRSSLIPRDPLAEVEACRTFERACLLAGLTPDAMTFVKLRLRYGTAITGAELPGLLNWLPSRVEAALRDLRRKKERIRKFLHGA
jgi:hypothetical protein